MDTQGVGENLLNNYPETNNEAAYELHAMCDKCKTIPNQYITLTCDHNICLVCLALQYFMMKKRENADYPDLNPVFLPCDLCGRGTELEPDTIAAVENVIEQNFFQEENEEKQGGFQLAELDYNDCESKPVSNNEGDRSLERGFIQSSEVSVGDKSDRSNSRALNMPLSRKENDQKASEVELGYAVLEERKSNREKGSGPHDAAKPRTAQESRPANIFLKKGESKRVQLCDRHPSEIITLICFTCDFQGVCLDCLVDGAHINHDIKSFSTASSHLKEIGSELAFHLKQGENNVNLEIRKVEKCLNQLDMNARDATTAATAAISEVEQALLAKEREAKQELQGSVEELISPSRNLQKRLKEGIETLRGFLKTTQKIQKVQGPSPDMLIGLFLEFLQNKEAVEKVLSDASVKDEEIKGVLEAECRVTEEVFDQYKQSLSRIKRGIEEIKIQGSQNRQPPSKEPETKARSFVQDKGKGNSEPSEIVEGTQDTTPKKFSKASFISKPEIFTDFSASSRKKPQEASLVTRERFFPQSQEYFIPGENLYKTTRSRMLTSSPNQMMPSFLKNSSLSRMRTSAFNLSFKSGINASIDRSLGANNIFSSPHSKLAQKFQKTFDINSSSVGQRSLKDLKKHLGGPNASFERAELKATTGNFSLKRGEKEYLNLKLLGQKKYFDLKKLSVSGTKFI